MDRTGMANNVDTTLADIHRTRRRISDAFGGDIRAISEDARKRQEQSGRKTVSFAEVTSATEESASDRRK